MNEMIGQLTAVSLGAGVLGLVVAVFFYFRVKGLPEGTDTMNMIGRYIREGSMAFLVREYKVLAIYSLAVFAFLFFAFQGQGTGLLAGFCFLFGAFLSLFSGFVGMKAATFANVRTCQAAREGSISMVSVFVVGRCASRRRGLTSGVAGFIDFECRII